VSQRGELGPDQVALFAPACGVAVAKLYCSQHLVSLIAPAPGLHAGLIGFIVALTQLGYGVGLLCLVPPSNVFENRRLVTSACGTVAIGLLGSALWRVQTSDRGALLGRAIRHEPDQTVCS